MADAEVELVAETRLSHRGRLIQAGQKLLATAEHAETLIAEGLARHPSDAEPVEPEAEPQPEPEAPPAETE